MKLSKINKKIVSCVLALSLVMSGIALSPAKASKAADAVPGVKVLGATLRTSGNTGSSQSMRVAIQVNHADKAGCCGIEIGIKGSGKTKTISTDDENGKNIYSKNEDYSTIVYTVVIENIPLANVATDFDIKGFVKPLNSITDEKTETTVATKSVNGIVNAIGTSIGKELKFLTSGDYAGTLVYEYDRLDMTDAKSNIEFKDKDGDYSSGKFIAGRNENRVDCVYDAESEAEPFYRVTSFEKLVSDTDDKIHVSSQGKGLGYNHNGMNKADYYIYSAKVKMTSDVKLTIMGLYGWNTGGNGQDNKSIQGNGEWQTFDVKTNNEGYEGSNYYCTKNAPSQEYCIKNIVIYKVLAESSITPKLSGWNKNHTTYNLPINSTSIKNTEGGCSVTINEDGEALVTAGGYQGFAIYTPAELSGSVITKMKVTYKNGVNGFNYTFKYSEDSGEDGLKWAGELNGSGEKEFTIKPEKNLTYLKFFPGGNASTVITSVVYTVEPSE